MNGRRGKTDRTVLALALVFAGLTGCEPPAGRNAGKVEMVQRGWSPSQVQEKIGKPHRVIQGEWIDLGRDEWVYPAGSVIFRRMSVVEIRPRKPGEHVPQAKRSDFDVYSRNPFEEEDEYYKLRGEEDARRKARYDGLHSKSFRPYRSSEEMERERQWKEDDRVSRARGTERY